MFSENRGGQVVCLLVHDERPSHAVVKLALDDVGLRYELATEPHGDVVLASFASARSDLRRRCLELRGAAASAKLVVAAPVDVAGTVACFDAGCDDVLRMPMDRVEIAARVAARVRRGRRSRWLDARLLYDHGVERWLTPTEAALVRALLAHDAPLESVALVRIVFGLHTGGNERLRQLVRRVRRKGVVIERVGGGYRLGRG